MVSFLFEIWVRIEEVSIVFGYCLYIVLKVVFVL